MKMVTQRQVLHASLTLFLITMATETAARCSFADRLTSTSLWESHITLNRQATELQWRFYEHQFAIVNSTDDQSDGVVYLCSEVFPDSTYLVQVTPGDSYMCVKFLSRTRHVVQVARSRSSSSPDPSLCDSLELDPWALVDPVMHESYQECPLTGGYDFYAYDNLEGYTLCEWDTLKPKLESECLRGEGMFWDFRSVICLGRQLMAIEQTLMCMGTWTEGAYRFTLLITQTDAWPLMWILRVPLANELKFTAYLFNDLVIETNEIPDHTSDFFKLYLSISSFSTLCENEQSQCSTASCMSPSDIYCQKTCQFCSYMLNVSTCAFDIAIQGEWKLVSATGHSDVTVGASQVNPFGEHSLTCFGLTSGDDEYVTLVASFTNGCRPRFACAQMEALSPSVLHYRLGQSLVWPGTTTLLNEGEICATDQFREDNFLLNDAVHSNKMRALVRKPPRGGPLVSEPCGLDGQFLMHAVQNGSPVSCLSTLSACDEEDQMTLHADLTCGGDIILAHFSCLGHFKHNDHHFIITVTDHSSASFCWAFYKDIWDPVYTIYLLYASDCYNDVGDDIRFDHFTRHLAEFRVSPGDGYLQASHCPAMSISPTRSTHSTTHEFFSRYDATTQLPSKTPATTKEQSDNGNNNDKQSKPTKAKFKSTAQSFKLNTCLSMILVTAYVVYSLDFVLIN